MSTGRAPVPVVFVRHRYRTHATHSGYDRLAERIPGEIVETKSSEPLARFVPAGVFSWVRRASGVERYHHRRMLAEARAAIRYLFRGRRVFHFLYGDYGYRYLGALPNLHGHRIVASFHLPPAVLERTIGNPEYLSRLDRAIILGERQRAFFRRFLDDRRIVNVPYFVDTDFFCPEGDREPGLCLFVGYYLRDLALLAETALRLASSEPEARILAVVRQSQAREIEGAANVEIRSGLTDEELRSLYRRASVLLLPLTDAVANNTILEAMACGLPIVSTDVGSVREYVGGAAGILAPSGDAEAHAAAVSTLIRDSTSAFEASRAARARAESRFALGVVARRIADLLAEVADSG